MLKTRITEQYGLKVPFINAGMAFIATAPLVRAVCNAGGMGVLGIPAMPPDVLQAAIRDAMTAGSNENVAAAMQSLPFPSWLQVVLPMVGLLLLRWHSVPMRSGSGLACSRASRPMPIRSTRTGSSLPASRILLAI